jgi:hypothetical protein
MQNTYITQYVNPNSEIHTAAMFVLLVEEK